MLPEPTFSFTIPSIYDDATLECRIYHPPKSSRRHYDGSKSIAGGAIVAHPYAPMGGCYDDHVVLASVTEILRQGYVVGTFNFRGAGHSKCRTSWTGKPELYDYISFIGFLVFYMTALHISDDSGSTPKSPEEPLHRISTGVALKSVSITSSESLKLILGGYSYGSLIASHLPSIDAIIERFSSVQQGTAAAEIRLRASRLAQQRNHDVRLYQDLHRGGSLKTSGAPNAMSVAVGGDECEPGSRRPSRESRRSMDGVRRSFDHTRRILTRHASDTSQPSPVDSSQTISSDSMPTIRVMYLLISPLLPPASSLATMFTKLTSSRFHKGPFGDSSFVEMDDRLSNHESLILYGSKDGFTSHRKLRAWCESLKAKAGSRFSFREVAAVGHFWTEEGVEAEMRNTIGQWLGQGEYFVIQ